jgi:putative DNA-binding protein
LSDLASFQDEFVRALAGEPAPSHWGEPGPIQSGLAVYRNTVVKGALDTLEANYPTVARLVGEEWFRAAAHAFLVESPPAVPMLCAYGAEFPAFLDGFAPARALPYLADVARIDRLWTEAHFAADGLLLAPEALPEADADALQGARLALHPSVRVGWFDSPAPTIWRLNRPPVPPPEPIQLPWRAEGVLLARPRGAVEAHLLDRSGFEFLACCASGATLGECAIAALSVDPSADLETHIADFFAAGVFAGASWQVG